MPVDKSKYSKKWKYISLSIRKRAGWACEFCGARNGLQHPETGSTVVLTVAHLDHDTNNDSTENLRALCQRCHLRYDHKLHRQNSAETRRRKRHVNQIELW